MLVGAYVGFATVGVFCAWYMYDSVLGIDLSGDGHTTVTWQQLRSWESCASWSPAFQACGAAAAPVACRLDCSRGAAMGCTADWTFDSPIACRALHAVL